MRLLGAQAALASLIALAAEVVLTGLFAVLFPYDAVFALVGVGLLGTGLGAALAARRPLALPLAWLALAGGLALPLAACLLLHDLSATPPFALAAAVPFAAAGALGARLFQAAGPSGAHRLYAADMAGVAAGGWAGVLLLSTLGAVRALAALAALAAAGSLLAARGPRRAVGAAGALAAALAVGALPVAPPLALARGASPAKTLIPLLHTPGHPLLASVWTAFGLTNLVGAPPGQPRTVFLDAGAGSYILPHRSLSGLPPLVLLPWSVWHPLRVLDIGAGGGLDAVAARAAGATSVVAVDINPALPQVMAEEAPFSGGVYRGPYIRLVVADGRRYAEQSRGRYDAVVLDLVYSQAAQAGAYALAESYAFTVQAFAAYLRRLTPQGVLVVVGHQAVEGARALFTALEAAHRLWGMSYREGLRHVLLAFTPTPDPQARPTLLIFQRYPFTPGEVMARILPALAAAGASPLYVPYAFTGTLAGLARPGASLAAFLAGSAYNYAPTTDDRPFFFQFAPGLPPALGGWLALSVLAAAAVALILRRSSAAPSAALALTGGAFAALEVTATASASLVFGYPTVAFAAVLAAFGIGAGLAAGRRCPPRPAAAAAEAAVAAAALAALGLPVAEGLLAARIPAPLSQAAMALALVPVGFALGRVFPGLLALCPEEEVARGFALSALGSMVAASLAELAALAGGFSTAAWGAAAAYGAAALLLRSARPGARASLPAAARLPR